MPDEGLINELQSYLSVSKVVAFIKRHRVRVVIPGNGRTARECIFDFDVDETIDTETLNSEYDFYNVDEQHEIIQRLLEHFSEVDPSYGSLGYDGLLNMLVDIIQERR